MNFAKLLKNIWALFLTPILVSILLLFSLLLFLPLRLHRSFVCLAAKLFKKNELGKLVTCAGSMFASEDIHGIYHWTSFVSFELPIPSPNVELLRRLVVKNGIEAKSEDGSLKYPELSQEQRKWMGHLFWAKPDLEFDVKKHVASLEDLKIKAPNFPNRTSFQHFLLTDLVRNRPWVKGRPLWDFIIVPNIPKRILDPLNQNDELFKGQQFGSVVILRMHHSLGDAISGVKMLSSILEFDHIKRIKPKAMTSNYSSVKFVAKLGEFWALVKSPFIFVHSNVRMGQRNLAKIPVLGETKDPFKCDIGLVGISSDNFSVQKIKDLKNFYGVEFMAVLLAVAAGGIRKMILSHGGKLEADADIDMQFPLPMPGHPDKLRNHMTVGRLPLPIGISDPICRLHKIQHRIKSIRRSNLPFAYFLAAKLVGSLPYALKKSLRAAFQKNKGPATHVFTNIPGPDGPIFIDGAQVLSVDVGTNAPIGMGNVYAFLFVTYHGRCRLVTGSVKRFYRDVNDAKEMMGYMLEELDVLGQSASV